MTQSHGENADPLWYKDAVIYELHVKTFCDSDGDGIGDFRGLNDKLDFLQELGITAIWLLPFYPDRKSTRLNSSHVKISYAVFCLKKKKKTKNMTIIHKHQ